MKNFNQRTVLVQDGGNRLFIAPDGGWTSDEARARDFHDTLSATVFCLQRHVAHAQVRVQFNLPGAADVVIPVSVDSHTGSARV